MLKAGIILENGHDSKGSLRSLLQGFLVQGHYFALMKQDVIQLQLYCHLRFLESLYQSRKKIFLKAFEETTKYDGI